MYPSHRMFSVFQRYTIQPEIICICSIIYRFYQLFAHAFDYRWSIKAAYVFKQTGLFAPNVPEMKILANREKFTDK